MTDMSDVHTLPLLYKGKRRNYVRFYPGRTPQQRLDGSQSAEKLFGSARYARVGSEAGPLIGPAEDLANGGMQLRTGAGIMTGVPYTPRGDLARNWVRSHTIRDEARKPKYLKKFIDLLTIQVGSDGRLSAVPLEEDEGNFVNFEISTGDLEETEEAYMAALSGHWHHGSVEYIGDASIHIPESMKPLAKIKSKKGKKAPIEQAGTGNVSAAQTFAQLRAEDHGAMVAPGVYLWSTLVWRVEYTAEQSEIVFVRQGGRFYRCLVHRDAAWAIPYTEPDAEQKWLNTLSVVASMQTTPLIAPETGVLEPFAPEEADAA